MTQYPENTVFSINMLLTKNKELMNELRELCGGMAAKDLDLENYLVETQYGNKIVPVSIVSPEIAAITLDNIRSVYARILENNATINALIAEQEAYVIEEYEAYKLLEENAATTSLKNVMSIFAAGTGLDSEDVAQDYGNIIAEHFFGLKLTGVTLVNMITNGDFADGTVNFYRGGTQVGWGTDGMATLSAVVGELRVTGTGSNAGPYAYSGVFMDDAGSDDIFVVATFEVDSADCDYFSFGLSGGTSKTIANPEMGRKYTVGVKGTQSNGRISLSHTYADAATANGKVMKVTNLMVINMSAVGLSNLSDDEMLGYALKGYFEAAKDVVNPKYTVVSKNLLDTDSLVDGYYWSSSNTLTDKTGTADPGIYFYSPEYIPVMEGTKIWGNHTNSSVQIMEFGPERAFIQRVNIDSNESYTVPAGVVEIRASFYNQESIRKETAMLSISDVSIEGDAFIAHDAQTETFPVTLRKVPAIEDTLGLNADRDKWVKTKNIHITTLAAEHIGVPSNGTNVMRLAILDPALPDFFAQSTSAKEGCVVLSDPRFQQEIEATWDVVGGEWRFETTPTSGWLIMLTVPLNHYANQAAAQADLAGMEVRYRAATPVEEEIADVTAMPRVREDGIIYFSADDVATPGSEITYILPYAVAGQESGNFNYVTGDDYIYVTSDDYIYETEEE